MSRERIYKGNKKERCRQTEKKYRQSEKGKKAHKKSYEKYRKTIKGYLHHVFSRIKHRCYNTKDMSYKWYGAKGIKCKFKSSKEFVDYIINELKIDPRSLSIDRIDSNKHYEKGNVRFITLTENVKNRHKRAK